MEESLDDSSQVPVNKVKEVSFGIIHKHYPSNHDKIMVIVHTQRNSGKTSADSSLTMFIEIFALMWENVVLCFFLEVKEKKISSL